LLDRLEPTGSIQYQGGRLSQLVVFLDIRIERSSIKIRQYGLGLQSRKPSTEFPNCEEMSNRGNKCRQFLREAGVPSQGLCKVRPLLQDCVAQISRRPQ
jgi:hypothetical protein